MFAMVGSLLFLSSLRERLQPEAVPVEHVEQPL
jgi:hypothetical protein